MRYSKYSYLHRSRVHARIYDELSRLRVAASLHMRIAKVRKDWPRPEPPDQPAFLKVRDMLKAGPDQKKDAMIRKWMTSAEESWGDRCEWVHEPPEELIKSAEKYRDFYE
jgi:hypothetical protein